MTGAEFIPLILLALLFWFLVMRPARNRQKEFQATQQALAPGARVMTSSGFFGEIVTLTDDQAVLRLAPQVEVTVAKQAVAKVVDAPEATDRHDPPEGSV